MDFEPILSLLANSVAEAGDSALLVAQDVLTALQGAGITLDSLSEVELDLLLEAFPELAADALAAPGPAAPGNTAPASADVRFGSDRDWEYWGDGVYYERGPDGSYTGHSSGW